MNGATQQGLLINNRHIHRIGFRSTPRRFDKLIFLQAGNAVQPMAIDPACPCDLLIPIR